jgi:hypothetical protein
MHSRAEAALPPARKTRGALACSNPNYNQDRLWRLSEQLGVSAPPKPGLLFYKRFGIAVQTAVAAFKAVPADIKAFSAAAHLSLPFCLSQ